MQHVSHFLTSFSLESHNSEEKDKQKHSVVSDTQLLLSAASLQIFIQHVVVTVNIILIIRI